MPSERVNRRPDDHYPAVCARCAKRPALVWQRCEFNKPLMGQTMLRGRARYHTFHYELPVCEVCRRSIRETRLVFGVFAVVLIALAVLAFIVLDIPTGGETIEQGGWGALAGVGAAVLIYAVVVAPFNDPAFSTYDGKLYGFKNAAYRNQFAALNPNLSKASSTLSAAAVVRFDRHASLKGYADDLIAELQGGKSYAHVVARLKGVGLAEDEVAVVLRYLERYRE